MADGTKAAGALPTNIMDPSTYARTALTGTEPSQIEAMNQAYMDAIKALEQRYEQPNWFKVAAGFAKPQLGGFLASVGSAAEAMGENTELARAQQLPIAQYRAALAQGQMLLAQNKKVTDQINAWRADPKNAGKTPSADQIATWESMAPESPAVKALVAQQRLSMEQRTLSQKEQQQTLETISQQRANAEKLAVTGQISAAEYRQRIALYDAQLAALQQASGLGNAVPTGAGAAAGAAPAESGAPSAGGAPQAPTAAKPAAPAGGARPRAEGLLPQVHPMPALDTSVMSPLQIEQQRALMEAAKGRAAEDEKIHLGKYNQLQTFSSALGNYADVERAKKTIQHIFSKDAPGAQKLIDAVRESGPLAAAVAAGFAFHAGSISANISLPVNEYQIAGLDVGKKTDYDALLGAFATLASAGMHSEGITPQTYHPAMFQQSMAKYAGMGQTAPNAYHTSMQSALNFREQHELAKLLREEFKRTNPNSLARYTDAFNSPKVTTLRDVFNEQRNALQRNFLEGTR